MESVSPPFLKASSAEYCLAVTSFHGWNTFLPGLWFYAEESVDTLKRIALRVAGYHSLADTVPVLSCTIGSCIQFAMVIASPVMSI